MAPRKTAGTESPAVYIIFRSFAVRLGRREESICTEASAASVMQEGGYSDASVASVTPALSVPVLSWTVSFSAGSSTCRVLTSKRRILA